MAKFLYYSIFVLAFLAGCVMGDMIYTMIKGLAN